MKSIRVDRDNVYIINRCVTLTVPHRKPETIENILITKLHFEQLLTECCCSYLVLLLLLTYLSNITIFMS